jgi:hypothetical protein
MNRTIRLSIIASSAIATWVGWDAGVHAQTYVVTSQQPQYVAVPQPQYVTAMPVFQRRPLFSRVAVMQAPQVQVGATPAVGTSFVTVGSGQLVSSGNFLVSSSLTSHGPVESVSQVEAPHLSRFVDSSGNSLGGLLKGLLRQFLSLNGPTDQNSLLNIGKTILNGILPFLSNMGGFDSGSAISDIEKIIISLLNEKPNGQGGAVTGTVTLANGSYSISFKDSTGKTIQGIITIGSSGTPPITPPPNPGSSSASDPADRAPNPAPNPNF